MATSTTNLNLTKPAGTEDASVLDINSNMDKIDAAVGRNNLLVTFSSISALPQTISNSKITANHVVVNAEFSNPAAQASDWSYTTSAGSITITGTISGTTTVYVHLSEVY